MSQEEETLKKLQVQTGWGPRTVTWLLLRYIENQKSPEAFIDFLQTEIDQSSDSAV